MRMKCPNCGFELQEEPDIEEKPFDLVPVIKCSKLLNAISEESIQ